MFQNKLPKVKYALESKKEQLKLDYKNAEKIYERKFDEKKNWLK